MKFILSIFFFYVALYSHTILIDSKTTNLSILENSYQFIDKGSKKDPSEIFNLDSTSFKTIKNNFINYGYMFSDTLWIKFRLKNSSEKKITKELVFDSPNIDILNLYYKQDELIEIKNGIFNRTSFNNELAFHFPISLEPNKEQTYFLKIKAITHSLHFSLHIKSYKEFKNDDMKQQLALSIFFAILFVIIFYNGVIYLYSREKIYLYYSFFVLTIFLHHLSLKGMVAYFTPSSLIIEQSYMPPYYMAATMISMILFVNMFLNLYKYKKIFFVIKLFILSVFTLVILNSTSHYLLNYLTPIALLEVLYLEGVGFYLYLHQKEKYAKYFFFIWTISLLGILLTILYYEGIYLHPIKFLMEITFAVEVLLFSVILSSHVKDLRIEKLKKDNLFLEQSKMASMGSMLQSISHQWRQPLSEINAIVMKIDADNYEKKLTKTTLDSDLDAIENITAYLSDTIDSFTSYSQQNRTVQKISFETIIKKSLQLMDSLLHDVKLNVTIHKESHHELNINEMIQVVLVILNNAVTALNQNNIKNKLISITMFQENSKNILTIEDNAGGINKEDLLKVFDPYFTTKFESQGVGIGLYMAKKIIKSYDGTLTVSNTNHGAKFTITL